jgi:uroporphyrinogen decarboxylase
MTSYERLLSAVSGRSRDRTPVAPQVFGNAAKLTGHSLREYVSDGRVLAESQLRVRNEVGYDILFAFADLNIEAEALGCALRCEDDAYPSIEKHLIAMPGDARDLAVPDPVGSGRMPVVLEACARLREAVGNECVISACVTGPVTIASQLTGIEPFLYQVADSPAAVNSLLDFTERVAIAYGKALLRAGAHCIVIFDPVASPAVLPPSLFVNYEFPRLARMSKAFRLAGASVSWISIAGATQKLMPYFSRAGINLATVDYVVPLGEALGLSGDVAVNGNLKPYSFVTDSAALLKASATKCLLAARGSNRFILGSGCEVPVETKIENLRALVDAVAEFKDNDFAVRAGAHEP